MRASRLSLIAAFAVLSTGASAQTMPWPTPDQPRAGATAPGAATAPAAPPAPMAMPMPMGGGAPMGGRFPGGAAPMGGGFPGGLAPMGGGLAGPPAGAAEPPCMPEFIKLRSDVETKSRAAKAVSEKKPSREEMCKQVTIVSTAEAKWVKFTEANVAGCGIPREIAQQLKTMHDHTDQARKSICAAGPAPPPPSLSDALGTARLPMPETTKSSGGSTLDTLNGNILQK